MNCIVLRMLFLSETDSISMLPISDYAWTEQQFMQLISTFADVYFRDVSAPLESTGSVYYWPL